MNNENFMNNNNNAMINSNFINQNFNGYTNGMNNKMNNNMGIMNNNYNYNNMNDNYYFQMNMNTLNNNFNYNNMNNIMMNNINNNNMNFNNNFNNNSMNNGINNNNQNNMNMIVMNNIMNNDMNNNNNFNINNNMNMNNGMNVNNNINNMNMDNNMNMNNNLNNELDNLNYGDNVNMINNNKNQNNMNLMNQNFMNNKIYPNNNMNNMISNNMSNMNPNNMNMINNNIIFQNQNENFYKNNNFGMIKGYNNNININNNTFINNNIFDSNNIIHLNKNTEQQLKQLCLNINIDFNYQHSSIMKYYLNIIYYDENLKTPENYYNCAFFQMNTKGTFYGCHSFELFRNICDKIKDTQKEFVLISSGRGANQIFNYCYDIEEIREYFIYCNYTSNYEYLKEKYPKLKKIFNNFDDLKGELLLCYPIKNKIIKSSNFIFFDDYNRIYIKFHFEIIRKYLMYKLLKSEMNNNDLLQIIKYKHPYYIELGRQLIDHDEKDMIKFFREKTDESEENIKQAFNCCHNSDNYITLYTFESFYYKYLNRFLREGDFNYFRILSSHIAKIIYHLYDFRANNIQHHDTSLLFRNIYINEDDFNKYLYSKDKVICFPSFTSTSLNDNVFKPIKNNPKDLFVKLIIEQNNTKSVIAICEKSKNPNEKEYLFLPFSFFKIVDIKEGEGNEQDPHRIFLIALNSEKPLEDMFIDFMIKETDNLDPEGLDMLELSKEDSYISINNPAIIKDKNQNQN